MTIEDQLHKEVRAETPTLQESQPIIAIAWFRWMADPNAVVSQTDGFGGRNSVLFRGH